MFLCVLEKGTYPESKVCEYSYLPNNRLFVPSNKIVVFLKGNIKYKNITQFAEFCKFQFASFFL